MKYFHTMPIEKFTSLVVNEDAEALKIIDSWSIEKEEVVAIIVRHFHQLGVFAVKPLRHGQLVHNNILFLLKNSPELRQRLQKIKEEMLRNKARGGRHKV